MGLSLLIFTPTWIDPQTNEDAIRPEVERAIKEQVGIDFDWHVTTDNPYPIYDENDRRHKTSYRNVLHQYQQARLYFLQGHWDALLTVEHDNVLPDPEAAKRMAETPGDVVYAPYLLRHGQKMLNTFQYINDRNLGMSLSNYRPELSRARQEIVHRISGAGFGCTLIRRHVLEAIEFTGTVPRDQNWCPDLRFAEDCLKKRFISNGRFDVPVLHWDGQTCWHPFQNRRNSVAKYIAVETMNAMAAGRFIRLAQGQEIELTDEEAQELMRMGAVARITEALSQSESTE
ncbi:MAG: hypothetical protein ACM3U2_15400, partial [Deltaproteobacteria bacterium]